MRVLDLSADPRLPQVLELLRSVSRARSSVEVISQFTERFGELRPVDLYVGVAPEPREPGAYRVLYTTVPGEAVDPRIVARARDPRAIRELPLHRGGVIGAWTGEPTPKVVVGLEVPDDPALGSRIASMRSCLVLPLFRDGELREWVLGFSRRGVVPDAAGVAEALMTANLVGIANWNLDAAAEIRRLNAALTNQLDQVGRLQQILLPRELPDIPGLEIATSYLTSDQSGGDYYDFFPLPDGAWGVLIADVSGHGAAAATVMAMLHAIVHSFRTLDAGQRGPAEILGFANRRLVETGLDGSFVTAFLGAYTPGRAEFRYASCGHNPPRLREGASGRVRGVDDVGTLPLGITQPLEVGTAAITLRPGDTLVLYTDGITEVFNAEREMFGVKRLDRIVEACDGSPDCVIDSVHTALHAHRGSATRDDDQTLVVLRQRGASGVRR